MMINASSPRAPSELDLTRTIYNHSQEQILDNKFSNSASIKEIRIKKNFTPQHSI